MEWVVYDFSWPVAERYEIKRGKVVAHGKVTTRQPLDVGPLAQALLSVYARYQKESDPLEKTVHSFASAFGLLEAESKEGQSERLDDWLGLIETLAGQLQEIENAAQSGQWKAPATPLSANMRATLVRAPLTNFPKLEFRPVNLREAIVLQLAHKIATGAIIKTCLQCGNYFEAGSAGKRADARFCSEACRFAFNNERRRAKNA